MWGSAAGGRISLDIRGIRIYITNTQKAEDPTTISQELTPQEPMEEHPVSPSIEIQLLPSDKEAVEITCRPELEEAEALQTKDDKKRLSGAAKKRLYGTLRQTPEEACMPALKPFMEPTKDNKRPRSLGLTQEYRNAKHSNPSLSTTKPTPTIKQVLQAVKIGVLHA